MSRSFAIDRHPSEPPPPATIDNIAALHCAAFVVEEPSRPARRRKTRSTDLELADVLEGIWRSRFGEVPVCAQRDIAEIRRRP